MGVWLISAGFLLLGHTSAMAESYLRVRKNGIIYYYFTSRGSPPLIQEPSPHHNLPPSSVKALTRKEFNFNPEATSPEGAPGLSPLIPGTPDELQVVNPYEAKEYIWAGTRYLLRLLTKLGYRYPLALPAYDAGLRRVERHQNGPAIQEPKAFVQDGRDYFLKYAQERSELGQMTQGLACFKESNQPYYRFPVSPPFSFKDSWGDYRNGGKTHRAVDIFAHEGAAVYAVTAGVIDTLSTREGAGITLLMRGQDGRGYGYMHLQGYAEGIVKGKAVRTGELLGYVGRTGIRQSAAHLHFQVYADHRLGKNELLNPYYFLVQLCRGVGVTDLYNHQIASLQNPQIKVNKIQVYRRTGSKNLKDRGDQRIVKDSSILVIRNF